MMKKLQGAWIVHHGTKLQTVAQTIDFQEIEFAGKCGILLSALASDKNTELPKRRVEGMAKAAKLNIHTELPAILDKLAEQQLIDKSATGAIAVLGLSTSAVLGHTSDIFASTEPNMSEYAAIGIAERTSQMPYTDKDIKEWTSDTYKLTKEVTSELLMTSANIGFIDTQAVDSTNQIYFNGNLFRVDNPSKINAVLNSLNANDRKLMSEIEQILVSKGCIEESDGRKILGEILFNKLHSIGIFDVSSVHNERETSNYITRPGAFAKFGDALCDDAFDLAKAFIASLTYGMTKSVHSRGKIYLLNALLDKLIRGQTLNPSTAAGQDYKILELKGVVETEHAHSGMFTMKLLKREIGVIAKQILNFGDASEASLKSLPGASVTTFTSPEANRTIKRTQIPDLDKKSTAALLMDIRTGTYR